MNNNTLLYNQFIANNYKSMKINPQSLKNAEHPPHDSNIERKRSLFKPPQFHIAPQLELPRFYSSDEKIKRKNVIVQTDQRDSPSHPHHHRSNAEQTKRDSVKYSKTEKNQTPSKGQSSLNKVRIIQEKLGEALFKSSPNDAHKSKPKHKKVDYHDILHTEKSENRKVKEMPENGEPNNQTKIRYKIANQKRIDVDNIHKRLIEAVETEAALQRKFDAQKSIRQSKAVTEQCLKNPLKEKSKPIIKVEPTFNDYVTDPKAQLTRKDQKMRTLSVFETVTKPKCKLSAEEKEHLRTMQDILKKTVKGTGNLDYPESYIVCDKFKFEKKYFALIEAKHQLEFKTNLILTRLTFYLCAHYILENISTKLLMGLFSKLIENHEVIMLLLGINEEKTKNEKYFSVNKYSTKDLLRLNQQFSEIAVETRGNNLHRNNEFVKLQLINLCKAKSFPHSHLFLSILNQEVSTHSLEDIREIDKNLKWEVLKMPTSPFLPTPHTKYSHYLILDLDETLIHFNPTRQTYHVRPFAPEFLENLSKYYELTVFTAATKEYADDIINEIDRGRLISHRLYRNHLTFLMGESLKDISMLGRDMQTTLIVDNLQANFRLHPENGILIKSWYGGDSDHILPKLQNLLIRIVLQFPEDLRKGVSLYGNYINREITERVKGYKLNYDL